MFRSDSVQGHSISIKHKREYSRCQWSAAMKTYWKIAAAALALTAGATAAMPASAQSFGLGFGPRGGISFSYDSGGYCDQSGCPDDFWDMPVFYGPVFWHGEWYDGPVYYREAFGHRQFWINGDWRNDEWRGPHPSWWREGRYGPALGVDYYRSHGFHGRWDRGGPGFDRRDNGRGPGFRDDRRNDGRGFDRRDDGRGGSGFRDDRRNDGRDDRHDDGRGGSDRRGDDHGGNRGPGQMDQRGGPAPQAQPLQQQGRGPQPQAAPAAAPAAAPGPRIGGRYGHGYNPDAAPGASPAPDDHHRDH
jgi:hypothetical protein